MTWKARLQIILNLITLVPALLYFFAWLAIVIASVFISMVLFILFGSVFLIVWSIGSSIRLKLRILGEVGDSKILPVRRIYSGAFRVNLVSYFILYPTMYAGSYFKVGIVPIFLLVALILAIPIRAYMSRLKRDYEIVKRTYLLGRWKCRRCKISLSYIRRFRRWKCHRCGIWY